MLYGHVRTKAPSCRAVAVFCFKPNLLLYFLLSCALSLYVPSFAFEPGTCTTCLCDLHKLPLEICACSSVLLCQCELGVQKE